MNRNYIDEQRTQIRDQDARKESGLYMWNATGAKTCRDCVGRHGVVRTWKQWESAGLPGAGTTICQYYCRCTLMKVERAKELYNANSVSELTKVAREPISARLDQIKALEKIRGDEFAPSTRIAKLGEFRSTNASLANVPSSSPLATERIKRVKQLSREKAKTGKLASLVGPRGGFSAQSRALEKGVKIYDARIAKRQGELKAAKNYRTRTR